AGWFLMESIRVTSIWFADWRGAYYYVPAPTILTCVLYYAVLLAAMTGWLFRPKLREWKLAGLGVAACLWSWQTWQDHAKTRVHGVPVHGGIATYCDAPGWRNNLLVDCGTTNSVTATTKPFLRAQGVNRLPALVLTHGDLHHVGGAELLNE